MRRCCSQINKNNLYREIIKAKMTFLRATHFHFPAFPSTALRKLRVISPNLANPLIYSRAVVACRPGMCCNQQTPLWKFSPTKPCFELVKSNASANSGETLWELFVLFAVPETFFSDSFTLTEMKREYGSGREVGRVPCIRKTAHPPATVV